MSEKEIKRRIKRRIKYWKEEEKWYRGSPIQKWGEVIDAVLAELNGLLDKEAGERR